MKRMRLKKYNCICTVLFVQVASSEQVLVIQIQHLETVFGVEIRNNSYCCCDQTSPPCVKTIEALNTSQCTTTCQPYFAVHFQYCPSTMLYNITKTFNFSVDPTSEISEFLIQLPLHQSELEMYNQVRICNCIVKNSTTIMV